MVVGCRINVVNLRSRGFKVADTFIGSILDRSACPIGLRRQVVARMGSLIERRVFPEFSSRGNRAPSVSPSRARRRSQVRVGIMEQGQEALTTQLGSPLRPALVFELVEPTDDLLLASFMHNPKS
jgi:hypothetical protein